MKIICDLCSKEFNIKYINSNESNVKKTYTTKKCNCGINIDYYYVIKAIDIFINNNNFKYKIELEFGGGKPYYILIDIKNNKELSLNYLNYFNFETFDLNVQSFITKQLKLINLK